MANKPNNDKAHPIKKYKISINKFLLVATIPTTNLVLLPYQQNDSSYPLRSLR